MKITSRDESCVWDGNYLTILDRHQYYIISESGKIYSAVLLKVDFFLSCYPVFFLCNYDSLTHT